MKNNKLSRLLYNKFFLISLCLFAVAGSVLFLQKEHFSYDRSNIQAYYQPRDREFILNIFKNNWYWLVSQYSTDFSAEYMLANKASSKRPEHLGNLTIKVYIDNSNPTGFVAYYMKRLYEGRILFLAIDERYRGRGYAKELINYAINDLKNKGADVVRLVTRTGNKVARSVYKKSGFKEIEDDGEFVTYEKVVL